MRACATHGKGVVLERDAWFPVRLGKLDNVTTQARRHDITLLWRACLLRTPPKENDLVSTNPWRFIYSIRL